MTPDKTPTDALAQLRHLYAQLKSQDGMSRADRSRIADGLLSPAIAALERWGSPVVAVEPVAWRYRMKGDLQWQYTERQEQFAHADEVQPLTTPQPTQAQAGAVPLTVAEIEQLIAQWSYELHGDRARYLVRMTEKHHGIKEGGQHGTESST